MLRFVLRFRMFAVAPSFVGLDCIRFVLSELLIVQSAFVLLWFFQTLIAVSSSWSQTDLSTLSGLCCTFRNTLLHESLPTFNRLAKTVLPLPRLILPSPRVSQLFDSYIVLNLSGIAAILLMKNVLSSLNTPPMSYKKEFCFATLVTRHGLVPW